MGLYDEQIREREEYDNRELEDACNGIVDAVLGNRKSTDEKFNKEVADNAINAILKYYHVDHNKDLSEIEDLEEKLDYALNPSGIMRRRVELTKGWYKDAYGPFLAIIEKNKKIVALLPYHSYTYMYYDEELHKYVKVDKNNEDMFEEEAYSFYRPFPNRKMTILDLIKYMQSIITIEDVISVLALYLLVTLLGMLTPKFTNLLYGTVANNKSVQLLVAAGVFMVMASFSQMIANSLKTFVMDRLNTKISMSVEAATMMRIMSLPPNFFRRYTSGELSSITGYINGLCRLIISTFLSTSLNSLFSLLYIYQIFNYAKALVVPAITVVVVTTVFNVFCTLANMRRQKQIMNYSAKSSGLGYALLSGIEKIKLTGSEKRAFTKWANNYTKLIELEFNPPLVLKISSVISVAITTVGTIVMYFISIKSGVNLGQYAAFMAAYGMLTGAFSGLASIVTQAANIRPLIDMCKPILEQIPEVSGEKEQIASIKGNVTIDNVTFRYDDKSPYVFEDFSLKIKKGQYAAIVGKTGCGKSTLIRLILGFERPESGAIYIDGRDIQSIDIRSLRSKIGTVIQNGKIFQGDIFDNIVVTAPKATIDDAWEAARIAGIEDDIKEMPMGMHTMISEGQGGISGGQKQRLMIARAVAGKPDLLILDEATSALDNITQKQVSDALASLKCTRIVIAHRLSTIQSCDRIIVIDGGKIIEDGTYDELINADGYFKELVARQMVE